MPNTTQEKQHSFYKIFLLKLESIHFTKNIDALLLIRLFLLASIYFATAKLGLELAFQAEQVTIVWPPTGIALAVLLLFGIRLWPGVLIGAFLANITTNEPLATATGIAIGNTLEAVIAVWLLRRFTNFNNNLFHIKDALHLIAFCAILNTPIAATIGIASLYLGGVQPWDILGSLWIQWLLGDASGALIVTPFILVLFHGYKAFHESNLYILEAILLVLGLIIANIAIFVLPITFVTNSFDLKYIIFLFVIWAALRFGQRGTTLVSVITSIIAIWATIHGIGPFRAGVITDGLLFLQIFMIVISITGLILGAAINERTAVEIELKASRERARLITEHALYAIITSNKSGIITEWNKQAENIFGWSHDEAVGKNIVNLIIAPEFLRIHPPEINQFLHFWPVEQMNRPIELVAIDKHGHTFAAELILTYQRLFDNSYFTLFIRNIAEQKLIQETKDLLAAIVESSTDAIISKNLSGTILSWNTAAEHLFGYNATEVIGKNINIIIPPDHIEEEKEIIAKLKEGKRLENFETVRKRKDGVLINLSLTISPIHDKTGKIIGASKIARPLITPVST